MSMANVSNTLQTGAQLAADETNPAPAFAGWGVSTGGSRGAVAAATATTAQVAAALAQLLEDLKAAFPGQFAA